MADEYTFTTERVRADLHLLWNLSGAPGKRAAIDAEFDRWLAAHDREVAAKALRDAADEVLRRRTLMGSSGDIRDDETWDNGNMSAEATIRARADRIELQASEKGASDGEQ